MKNVSVSYDSAPCERNIVHEACSIEALGEILGGTLSLHASMGTEDKSMGHGTCLLMEDPLVATNPRLFRGSNREFRARILKLQL